MRSLTAMAPTRWQRSAAASRRYVERFDRLERDGVDLHGEARLIDAVLPRGADVLDAGCGTGRVGAELARRGHRVTAVDLDPVLVAQARAHSNLVVHQADLATLDLGTDFDAVAMAGNVMVFLEPGTERRVVANVARHLRPDGVFVAGFATDRDYRVEQFHDDLRAAGFTVETTLSTWDLRPWHDGADWAVTIARLHGPLAIGSKNE